MNVDHTIFEDVSDALKIRNPAIPEKDYYVVQLLKLLKCIEPDYHHMVFSGGTSLTKHNIKIHRMSEDVDMKLVPLPEASAMSRNSLKKARKAFRDLVIDKLNQSDVFTVSGEDVKSRDKYRYSEIKVKYPQNFSQIPCLRPFIKLEFLETELIGEVIQIPIRSLLAEVSDDSPEVTDYPTSCLLTTQSEKIVSMLRRTASVKRKPDERADDKALVRHVYDAFHLHKAKGHKPDDIAPVVARIIKLDIERYGTQHESFVEAPLDELRYGLRLLHEDEFHQERYDEYLSPMVYGDNVSWSEAMEVFSSLSLQVLELIDKDQLLE